MLWLDSCEVAAFPQPLSLYPKVSALKKKYFCVSLTAGTFKLLIEFSEEYPNKPPTVRFVSRMFHPNGKMKHKCL